MGGRSAFFNTVCYKDDKGFRAEFGTDEAKTAAQNGDTAFYLTDENGVEYYCCGNTKIKITEHFAEDGKSMGELLEDLIIREAKKSVKD